MPSNRARSVTQAKLIDVFLSFYFLFFILFFALGRTRVHRPITTKKHPTYTPPGVLAFYCPDLSPEALFYVDILLRARWQLIKKCPFTLIWNNPWLLSFFSLSFFWFLMTSKMDTFIVHGHGSWAPLIGIESKTFALSWRRALEARFMQTYHTVFPLHSTRYV